MAKIVFTNVLMTNDYDIGIYFKDEIERNQYFNIPSIFEAQPEFNFSISGGLTTTLYWNQATFLNTSILDFNYCIIDINRRYYFYFIDKATCITSNQYQINLELDVITTYLPSLNFEDCFIERAHAPRWYTTDNINYKFNFSTNSPLLRKSEQYKQYLKNSIPLKRLFNNVNEAFNGISYIYLFAKVSEEETGICTTYHYNQNTSFKYPFKTFCIPYVQSSNESTIFKVSVGEEPFIKVYNKLDYEDLPKSINSAEIIGVTYSDFSPFNDLTELNIEFDSQTGNYIYNISVRNTMNSSIDLATAKSGDITSTTDTKYIQVYDIDISPKTYFTDTRVTFDKPKMSFTKNEIKNNSNNQLTCPILLKKGCKRLELSNYYSSKYDYSFEELNTNNITATVLIYPFPGIEYQYAFIKGATDSILKNQQQNFTGIVGSFDNTLPYKVEQIDEFFLSNKNYYQMRNVNLNVSSFNAFANLMKGGISGGVSMASGNVAKGTAQLATAPVQAGQDVVGILANETLLDMQLDNLENAPDTLNNLNGAPLTSFALNKIGFVINIYDILEEDKKFIANDYYEHGQNIAVWANPRDYLGTRKYFNYIKCTLKEMWINYYPYDPIPTVIKNKIKEVFAKGIRLFNGVNPTTIINSSTYIENYEKELD